MSSIEKRTMFLKGFPSTWNEQGLFRIYKVFGNVQEILLLRFRDGRSKCNAFITYYEEVSINKAVKFMEKIGFNFVNNTFSLYQGCILEHIYGHLQGFEENDNIEEKFKIFINNSESIQNKISNRKTHPDYNQSIQRGPTADRRVPTVDIDLKYRYPTFNDPYTTIPHNPSEFSSGFRQRSSSNSSTNDSTVSNSNYTRPCGSYELPPYEMPSNNIDAYQTPYNYEQYTVLPQMQIATSAESYAQSKLPQQWQQDLQHQMQIQIQQQLLQTGPADFQTGNQIKEHRYTENYRNYYYRN